ncbi:MAG: hypothetical protein WA137_12835 [Methanothrix sp.]
MSFKRDCIRWSSLHFCAIWLAVFCLTTSNCSIASDSIQPILMSKEDAAKKIIENVIPTINSTSLRVNQYPLLLDAGSRVMQAIPSGGMGSEYLVCENNSWLFFIDLAPNAHFAHPATITLLDAVSGEIRSLDAEWWPIIEMPFFKNQADRLDSNMIIYER